MSGRGRSRPGTTGRSPKVPSAREAGASVRAQRRPGARAGARHGSPAGGRDGEPALGTLRHVEAKELEALRQEIRTRVGVEPEPLLAYRQTFDESVPGTGVPISVEEIYRQAIAADLVLLGDYHTLAAAQRTALALARALARRRPLVLGLEMVRSEHQGVLDAYGEGTVSDTALRNLIRYDSHWPFPWSAYGPLLELGREAGVRLLALDGRGNLHRRDRRAADRLATSRAQHPESLHLALIGDLHLAPAHLPAQVAARCPLDRLVVIHQNLPGVHEQLAALSATDRLPAADLGNGHYCLITATPVARERSYLAWLEGSDGEVAAEPAHEIGRIADRLATVLEVPPLAAAGSTGDSGLEVHVRGGARFIRELEASGLSFARLVGVRREMSERGVAVVTSHGPVYVGQADEQHLAAAAAGLLQARAGEPPVAPDRPQPAWREADLLALVRREAFAALAWRLVEPLAGSVTEPQAVAFDPAAGPPPVHSRLRIERRARLLRARIAAHLNGRRAFALPLALVREPATTRAAVARAVGTHYADGLRDALLTAEVESAAVASLLAPPGPAGRARERRAVIELAALARAARRSPNDAGRAVPGLE